MKCLRRNCTNHRIKNILSDLYCLDCLNEFYEAGKAAILAKPHQPLNQEAFLTKFGYAGESQRVGNEVKNGNKDSKTTRIRAGVASFADLDLSINRGWPREIQETAHEVFSEKNLSQSAEKSRSCHLANFKSRASKFNATRGESK